MYKGYNFVQICKWSTNCVGGWVAVCKIFIHIYYEMKQNAFRTLNGLYDILETIPILPDSS